MAVDNMSDAGAPGDLDYLDDEGYPYVFPPSTHVLVGSYLIIVGVLGSVGNGLVLATFVRFRSLVTPTSLLLVNLATSDLGMILFGFPFSASSSLAGRWLYGDGGCQGYAFLGFLFGSAHIGTLALLALDRYLIACRINISKDRLLLFHLAAILLLMTSGQRGGPPTELQGGKLTYKRYSQMLLVVWCYALFWALMPLVGWGRYGLEPSVTACTIDWQHNDSSYRSFILVYFVLGFLVPLSMMTVCYASIVRRSRRAAKERSVVVRDQWTHERAVTWMSFILVVAFLLAWSPYAVLCLWTIFATPQSVPPFLTLVPPLFAKSSTVVNPLIYFVSNPKLRAAVLSTAACCSDAPLQDAELPGSPEGGATSEAL